jgi:integrase
LEIADRLGHESVKTTLDTYSHLYPDKDNELAGRLNQFRRKQSNESKERDFST